MNPTCMRCGQCCKGLLCLVPATEDSDLSPDHLESMSYEEACSYLNENTEFQGDVCKWLSYDKEGLAECTAYSHRSSMCRDHRSNEWCNIGYAYWMSVKHSGGDIPSSILSILRSHPANEMYRYFREEGN